MKNPEVGYPGDGNDIIADFKDGVDFIGTPFDYVTDIHNDGKNTVLEFEGGGSFTLLNVKPGRDHRGRLRTALNAIVD